MNRVLEFVVFGGPRNRDCASPVALYSVVGLALFFFGTWLLISSLTGLFPSEHLLGTVKQYPIAVVSIMLLGLALNRMTSNCIVASSRPLSTWAALLVSAISGTAIVWSGFDPSGVLPSAFRMSDVSSSAISAIVTDFTAPLFFLTSLSLALVLQRHKVLVSLGEGIAALILGVSLLCLPVIAFTSVDLPGGRAAMSAPLFTLVIFVCMAYGVVLSSQSSRLLKWLRSVETTGSLIRAMVSAIIFTPTIALLLRHLILVSLPGKVDENLVMALCFIFVIATLFTVGVRSVRQIATTDSKFHAIDARLVAVYQASPLGIIVSDSDSSAFHVNTSFTEITGLSLDESLGMGHRSVVHPDDLDMLASEWNQHDISSGNFEREHRIKLKDGTVKWVSVVVSPMYQNGVLTGYAASLADITQKRDADDALKSSEDRFRVMADCSPIGLILRDEHGEVYYANAALKAMSGLDEKDLTGSTWADRIHVDDRSRVRKNLEQFMAQAKDGERGTFQSEHRYNHPDGRVLSLFANVVPLIEDQRPSGFLSSIIDMTEIKRSQAALEESEHSFRTIFENAGDGIVSINKDDVIESINSRASEMFGYKPEELIGQPCVILMPDDLAILHTNKHAKFVSGQESTVVDNTREVYGQRKNGTQFPLELSVSELSQHHGSFIGILRDVSDRRKMEELLRSSEERFRAVTDESPAGICIRNERDEIVYHNAAMATIWGKDGQELTGSKFRATIHSDDTEVVQIKIEQFYKDISDGKDHVLRSLHRFVNGDVTKWVATTTTAIRLSNGEVHRASEILDVTEQKKFEQRLQASEEQFRTMAESSPFGIALRDASGKIYYANQSLQTMLGFSMDELKGSGWLDAIHVDDRDRIFENFTEFASLARSGKDLLFRSEHRYVIGENTNWLYVTVIPLRSGNELTGFLTSVIDVTQRRNAEQRIKESEERFRVMAETSPIGIFTHDAKGALTYVNESWCRISGISSEQALGDGWLEALPLDIRPQVEQFWRDFLISDDHEVTTEVPGLRGNDEFWARIHISKTFEDGVLAGFIGTSEDVTENKSVQSAILAAKEEAERANRGKNEFLSRMSHELRTPMNAILGFAQLLDLDPLKEDQQEGVEQIIKAGKHLLTLINEVLDITRIEDSSFGINCIPLNLGQVTRNVTTMLEPLANQQHVAFEIDPKLDDIGVLADNQRLTQVMLNLTSNAIKYNNRGGTVSISASCQNGSVDIFVADTGDGIPKEYIDRLFTPFDRLGAERSKIEGTGLGLALANRLIQAMNGVLQIESEVGKGTTATVTIPLADNPAARKTNKRDKPSTDVKKASKCKVLLVEDDEGSIALIKQFMGRFDQYELAIAETGERALSLAESFVPNIVLLDINLPDSSDTSVIDGILNMPVCKDAQVIVISADADENTIEKFLQAGAVKYLAKPIEIEELRLNLEMILADNRLR